MWKKNMRHGIWSAGMLLLLGLAMTRNVQAEADYTNPVIPIEDSIYDATGTIYLGAEESVIEEDELHGAGNVVHWSNSKKGLQGNEYLLDPDYQTLGIKHVLLNMVLSDCVAYSNGEYHLVDSSYAVDYQPLVSKLNAEGVKVTVVLLLRWSDDANLQELIYPAARQEGYRYYNPNCSDDLGRKAWSNIFHELIENYGTSDCHVDNWILCNEVNQYGSDTYNHTGTTDLNTKVQAYGDVFKVLNQAVADTYSSAKTYVSLDNNWTGTDTGLRSKDFLDVFATYMGSEQWGVAWHPYAPCMNSAENTDWSNKVIWNSPWVTNHITTKYICGSNLQVLTDYIKGKWGSSHRVLLSEQGYDATGSLAYQGAFIAYTYYAAQYNDLVDGVMFRSYLDAPDEFGLKFGLLSGSWNDMYAASDKRAYVSSHKRPVYDIFKYMDTDDAGSYTQPCLQAIGVSEWTDLLSGYNGPSPVGLWKKESGGVYLYRGSVKVTGWVKYKGVWYYMNPEQNGAMATGWAKVNGGWYYMNGSGVMQTGGWKKLGGKWYYLQSDGRAKTGWLKENNKWYYMDPTSAAMCTGAYQDGNAWYCSDGSGAMMKNGWKKVNGKWYYLRGNGSAITGWYKENNKWYYLNPDNGVMCTGWYKTKGTWYYSNGSGVMQSGGWKKINNKWYYLQGSGAMKTGWLKLSGKWYYLDATSGKMCTGWAKVKGTWYYMNSSGAMQSSGWKKINNKWYYLQNSGAMKTGWLKENGKWYYLNPSSGKMQTGKLELEDKIYTFNGSGALVSTQ